MGFRFLLLPFLVLALAAATGCSRSVTLAPAPAAVAAPGRGEGAVAHEDGIDVEARMQAWTGRPTELSDAVTPVLVKIDNHGDRALRVRYEDFALVSGSGRRYAAIPVYDIEGSVLRPTRRMLVPAHAFYVAPYLAAYYPWLPPYDGPFAYDPFYYDTYYRQMKRVELPTVDMVTMALPEGVVDRGGEVAGFLYFQPLDEDVEHVTFRARLFAAHRAEEIGAATIPFVAAD